MKKMSEKSKSTIGIVMFVVFVACMIAGYANGEAQTVLMKAINICLECIGIG